MSIPVTTQNWNKEDYITYIFLCIAAADYDIADEELTVLKDRIAEIVGDNIDINASIDKVKDDVDYHDDDEKTEVIKRFTELFKPSFEEKNTICKILEDIIKADGVVEGIEMVIFRFIKKALD